MITIMDPEDLLYDSAIRLWLQYSDSDESFASFVGLSDAYLISSTGRVLNVLRDKFLTPYVDSAGYHRYNLSYGSRTSTSAHRLVANAFISNPCGKPSVDHIDRNRRNNVVSNLRWATAKEQARNRQEINPGKNCGQSTPSEQWKQIVYGDVEFLHPYRISNLGRVELKYRKSTGSRHTSGYRVVVLDVVDGKRSIAVHRLVAYAFLGSPKDVDMVVNHKDGVKDNNHIDNLEWVSVSKNNHHSVRVLNTHLMRAVASYDRFNGELIKSYVCLSDARKDVGLDLATIQSAIKTKGLAGNSFWALVDNIESVPSKIDLSTRLIKEKIAAKYDRTTGKLICAYKHVAEAAKEHGINASSISNAIKKRVTCIGFIWELYKFNVPEIVNPSDYRLQKNIAAYPV